MIVASGFVMKIATFYTARCAGSLLRQDRTYPVLVPIVLRSSMIHSQEVAAKLRLGYGSGGMFRGDSLCAAQLLSETQCLQYSFVSPLYFGLHADFLVGQHLVHDELSLYDWPMYTRHFHAGTGQGSRRRHPPHDQSQSSG